MEEDEILFDEPAKNIGRIVPTAASETRRFRVRIELLTEERALRVALGDLADDFPELA